MNYKELNGESIRDGFDRFNKDNPDVFTAFEKEAFKAIHAGAKKISAKLIINVIRWRKFLNTTDDNFKINDAYQAYYARYFIAKHPQYNGIFEMRKLRNEEEKPFVIVEDDGQLTFL